MLELGEAYSGRLEMSRRVSNFPVQHPIPNVASVIDLAIGATNGRIERFCLCRQCGCLTIESLCKVPKKSLGQWDMGQAMSCVLSAIEVLGDGIVILDRSEVVGQDRKGTRERV